MGIFGFGGNEEIKRKMGLSPVLPGEMTELITLWRDIYSGHAPWLKDADWDKSASFAKLVCQDIAGKACNEFDIRIGEDEEATARIGKVMGDVLQEKTEKALALGAISARPYYDIDTKNILVDWYPADRVIPVAWDGDDLMSAIFVDYASTDKDHHYCKLESHVFSKGADASSSSCTITSKAFTFDGGTLGSEVSLSTVPAWAGITPEPIIIHNLDRPLFHYMKTPFANNKDGSPVGISIFANAIDQLEEIDRTFSDMAFERIAGRGRVFLDESMIPQKQIDGKWIDDISSFDKHYYKKLQGKEQGKDLFEVSAPELRLAAYKEHLEAVMSLACSIMQIDANAYVTDNTGMPATAKQVLTEEKRTYNTVLGIQNKMLVPAIRHILSSIRALEILYSTSERLPDDDAITISFGDSIMLDEDTERERAIQEVEKGLRSKLDYLMNFRGMSEEEARHEIEQINAEAPTYDYFGTGDGT